MPATRKVQVNKEDVEQLLGVFKDNEEEKREEKTPVLTNDMVSTVFKSNKPLAEKVKDIDPTSNIITEEKKEVSDTTVGIRMTTSKKREMKAYFIQHGTTMSQGVIDAFSLLKMLEEEGVVEYKDGILERV